MPHLLKYSCVPAGTLILFFVFFPVRHVYWVQARLLESNMAKSDDSTQRIMTVITLKTSENDNNSVFPWGSVAGVCRHCYWSVLVHDNQILAATPSYHSLRKRQSFKIHYLRYLCLFSTRRSNSLAAAPSYIVVDKSGHVFKYITYVICALSVPVHDDQILAAAPSHLLLRKRPRLYIRNSNYLCFMMMIMHSPCKFVCLAQSFRDLSEITSGWVGIDWKVGAVINYGR